MTSFRNSIFGAPSNKALPPKPPASSPSVESTSTPTVSSSHDVSAAVTPSASDTPFSPTGNTERRRKMSTSPSPPPTLTVRLQLFPHSDRPTHLPANAVDRNQYTAFSFTPVEKDLVPGSIVRIGRKVDSKHGGLGREKTRVSRRDGASRRENNVADNYVEDVEIDPRRFTYFGDDPIDEATPLASASTAPAPETGTVKKKAEFIAFRSKVVSRTHAEMWVGSEGQVYFRDVGSSSGTFLNRLRLSPSGKESIPHILKPGDVIQLGVDYQGRQEEIYKCVMIKVYVSVRPAGRTKGKPVRLRKAIRDLILAMNPTSSLNDPPTAECCICLNGMAPYQALFLAPCSHCFHYKCVTPLLNGGGGVSGMFLCPMCRGVANLEANVNDVDEDGEDDAPDSPSEVLASTEEARGSNTALLSQRPSALSHRPSQADMSSRIQEILSEAQAPVPRVTALDLDAMLSDGENDNGEGRPIPQQPVVAPTPEQEAAVATPISPSDSRMFVTLARPSKKASNAPIPSATGPPQTTEDTQDASELPGPSSPRTSDASSSKDATIQNLQELLQSYQDILKDAVNVMDPDAAENIRTRLKDIENRSSL
ncbi:hypothetical protein BC832DRAFT_561942 [Gaertneriomyces semiglobifer]|nr:hypothetical protein BC832DRAFT_561942 [Gaertneriomyces semiglobifer]